MEPVFVFFIALVIVFAITLVNIYTKSEKNFSIKNTNRTVLIGWKEVNVREGYSTTTPVITTLKLGDEVILTGSTYEYSGGDDSPENSWVEVTLQSGQNGWIVYSAIDW